MGTVIDSLVVSLGLDPKDFTKGQKEAVASLRATEEQAGKTAKEMQTRGKQAAEFYSKIRNEVLALGAAFFGARGVAEFTARMTAADAATGRLAKNLGTSVESLSAWEGVARRSGASAEDAASGMQGLVSNFQQLALTGQSSVIPYFRALGVNVADASGKMRPLDDILLDLADRFQALEPAQAQAFGAGIGLSQGMVNTLMQGRAALTELLAQQKRIGVVSKADTEAAQKLQKAWAGVRLSFDSLGRTILTEVTPAVSELLDEFRDWIVANKEEIGANFKAFAEWLKTIDWGAIRDGLKQFAHDANEAAQSVGGWIRITEVLLGLWVGTKVIGALAGIRSIALASGEAVAAIVAINPALAAAVAAAFAAKAVLSPSTTNAGEDEFIRAHPEMFPKPPTKEERDQLVVGPPGRNWLQALTGAEPGTSAAAPKPAARPATRPPVSARGSSNSDIDQLVALGWSREQSIGIVANLQRESSGIATKVGDGGKAYGLAQWHPDRQAAFAKWAGHDIRTATRAEQLGFIDYELRQGGERKAGAALSGAKSASDAAAIFSRMYERPANGDAEAAKRSSLALALASGPGPGVDPALLSGARASIASSGGGSGSTTVTSDVTINNVNINGTGITDADGVAKNLAAATRKYSYVPQANAGLA